LELGVIAAQYKLITDNEVPAMNAQLKQSGIAVVITPGAR
jgi:hypothetical protein